MSAAAPWVYQAPERPAGHPNQCYYRIAGASTHAIRRSQIPGWANIKLYRFDDWKHAQVEIDTFEARMRVNLDVPTLLALRNAINDALQDIAAQQDTAALLSEMPVDGSHGEYLA